jgi:hypothetical protein
MNEKMKLFITLFLKWMGMNVDSYRYQEIDNTHASVRPLAIEYKSEDTENIIRCGNEMGFNIKITKLARSIVDNDELGFTVTPDDLPKIESALNERGLIDGEIKISYLIKCFLRTCRWRPVDYMYMPENNKIHIQPFKFVPGNQLEEVRQIGTKIGFDIKLGKPDVACTDDIQELIFLTKKANLEKIKINLVTRISLSMI